MNLEEARLLLKNRLENSQRENCWVNEHCIGRQEERPENVLLWSISELDLSDKTSEGLYIAGISTVGQLAQMSPTELLEIKNVGPVGVGKIKKALASLRRRLKRKFKED